MATKIRLQRHGKKAKAFFHIVAADTRAKRDGRYIERLGVYNPNTNPATINIDFENTLKWVKSGAELSDTAKAILKYKGVIYKNHLDKGVLKGALTQEQADSKFEKWLGEKGTIIQKKVQSLDSVQVAESKKRFAAETEKKEAREKEILAKTSELAAEVAVAEEATSEEVAAEEATTENVVAEAAPEEIAEEKKEESAE